MPTGLKRTLGEHGKHNQKSHGGGGQRNPGTVEASIKSVSKSLGLKPSATGVFNTKSLTASKVHDGLRKSGFLAKKSELKKEIVTYKSMFGTVGARYNKRHNLLMFDAV